MAGKDTTLDFHDSGQDDVLFEQGNMQTHTFKDFPRSAQDEDDEEDKSELLKGDKKQLSFWTFEYYQQFFDVETTQVFHRVAGSMIPLPHRNFLQTHIRPSPDLYGPFWICTTLVFTTAIAGNLANYLASEGKDYQWKYDFHKVTFSATTIFCYWWLVPTAIYLTLWWRRSTAGYTFLEIICVYGYSLAIYIPISILWVVPFMWFKWTLVIVGALLSGGVLVLTFWSAVKDDTKRVAVIVISLIFLCHLLLASGFVLYFFHVPARTDIPAGTTTPAPTQPLKDVPKTQRLAGQDNPARQNIPETNKDKIDKVKTSSDKQSDGNKSDVKNVKTSPKASDKIDKQKEQSQTPEGSNTDTQPKQNEIPNQGSNEGVKKRAIKLKERLLRKGTRNV